jgi:hypothetical protein
MKVIIRLRFLLLTITTVVCMAGSSFAQNSVEQFYKGRTITIRAPSAPGGINDLVSRLVARYLRDHIPGHPNIIVQNLPGSGLAAANTLYNTAERDGTVIAFIERATPQTALQGDPNALFDPLKLTWLGSLSSYASDAYMLIVNAPHPVRNADDLRKAGVSLKLGSQHSASTNTEFAMLAKVVLGLNIDVGRGAHVPGDAAQRDRRTGDRAERTSRRSAAPVGFAFGPAARPICPRHAPCCHQGCTDRTGTGARRRLESAH